MIKLTKFSINNPKTVIIITLILTMFFGYLMKDIKIDTDPENMLSADNPVRTFHHEMKKHFGLNDMIVIGITAENTIFDKDTLKRIEQVTEEISKLKGVITDDIISPNTTNNVVQEEDTLVVRKIMPKAPDNQSAIEKLERELAGNSMFENLMISSDKKVLSIYVPIESKDMSFEISKKIEEIADKYLDGERYYVTGLPVAEDTFGYEMFMQMGISAPIAAFVIFLIMLYFFKRVSLIVSPMIIAVMSIIWAMGLLIGTGNTVHIMSSMIPIFLMPISVVDSVHVLSEFHDNYSRFGNKKDTLLHVMEELFMPMLYTSLTSAVGFASLSLTPIPPVRIFGLFVAFGIAIAWILTIAFVPAYIVLMVNEKSLQKSYSVKNSDTKSRIINILKRLELIVTGKGKTILALTLIIIFISIYGISKINVNDNPVKWFGKKHKIRVADEILNEHLGGTYMPYLVLTGEDEEVIKNPAVMKYIDDLQSKLKSLENVGKTTSIGDIVKRINYILHDEDQAFDVIPDTKEEISQYLFLYLMSGDPDDLDNFVDYDYKSANIWIQSKKGDNKDIERIVDFVNDHVKKNPPPSGLKKDWAGLSYINIIWQDAMVNGMIRSLLGSFAIVLLLMIFLFRSFIWGVISMIPLSVTILCTYGIVGLVGKDYDMPIAVLSSLTLGLSIDFAIHFIERFRLKYNSTGDFAKAAEEIFAEPARAIVRNSVIISVGFLPLLLSSLVPYKTVGAFLASIMLLSCTSTLMLLLPLMSMLRKPLKLNDNKKGDIK